MRRNKAKKQDSVETNRNVAESKNYMKKKRRKVLRTNKMSLPLHDNYTARN